jgi:hypothetical protein
MQALDRKDAERDEGSRRLLTKCPSAETGVGICKSPWLAGIEYNPTRYFARAVRPLRATKGAIILTL